MTHICVGKLTTIGSDSGLSLGWRQSIIWTNAGILLIGILGANFSETLIGIQTFSFNKMHLKVSSAKRYPFCLGLNVLIHMWHSSLSMMYRNVSCKRPIRMHFHDEAPALENGRSPGSRVFTAELTGRLCYTVYQVAPLLPMGAIGHD